MRRYSVLALLALAVPANATDFAPRDDQQFVALDAATGAVKWSAKPPAKLANAHFELYPGLLVVFPSYDQTDTSNPIFLDAKTGATATDSRDATKLRAKSSGHWPPPKVTLDGGWKLDTFEPGNTKNLTFTRGTATWTVRPLEYPEYVRGYRDLAIHAYGYLTDQAIVVAHRAGEAKPAWTIDFNHILQTTKATRFGRVAIHVADDRLFAQVGEHVFGIAPLAGLVVWHTNLARELGVPFRPGLFDGAIDLAVFAKDGPALVVAFEKRVIALDVVSGKLRWHVDPDTFPHTAYPVIADGVVYMTAGPKRARAVRAKP